ncbi:DUF1120 domain-containing protein [uncultured Ralstonia sp.]|jgi:type 1 fimbria pilin|uniref:DUF1120 domain-containing protein n=1 Tax=Ralstonia sp. TaxID=54061 RepID=UPI001EA7188A|nr:DUF1120 domain-containing protein [uncultured Ralstonia sp.]UCF22696.1 MAG: DUF1120 domain-containing protein [Ralstonia sp.]
MCVHVKARRRLLSGVVLCSLACPLLAQAQSAVLRVTGRIVPGSCVPELTGGGNVDFGDIPATTLPRTGYTDLGTRQTALKVQCPLPTTTAIRITDEHAGTQVDAARAVLGSTLATSQLFGLGRAEGAGVGAYTVRLTTPATVDGKAQPQTLVSPDGKQWATAQGTVYLDGSGAQAYAAGQRAAIARGKTMLYPLTVHAALNRADALPQDKVIGLAGQATLELVYP